MKRIAAQALTIALGALLCTPALSATEQSPAPEQEAIKAGTKAPNFTRTTTAGKKLTLKQFRGKKPVILYFYPKDESATCIKEACGFKDFYNGFTGSDVEIIGVSGDSNESHRAFASNHSLPFDLISDSDDSLLKLYRVPIFKGSMHKRVTFVIDKHGYIKNVIQYTNDADQHVKEATSALQMLQNE